MEKFKQLYDKFQKKSNLMDYIALVNYVWDLPHVKIPLTKEGGFFPAFPLFYENYSKKWVVIYSHDEFCKNEDKADAWTSMPVNKCISFFLDSECEGIAINPGTDYFFTVSVSRESEKENKQD